MSYSTCLLYKWSYIPRRELHVGRVQTRGHCFLEHASSKRESRSSLWNHFMSFFSGFRFCRNWKIYLTVHVNCIIKVTYPEQFLNNNFMLAVLKCARIMHAWQRKQFFPTKSLQRGRPDPIFKIVIRHFSDLFFEQSVYKILCHTCMYNRSIPYPEQFLNDNFIFFPVVTERART